MKVCILIIAMVLCSANARADPFCPFDCVGTGVEEGGFILPVGAGELTTDIGAEIEWGRTADLEVNLAWAENYYNMEFTFTDSGAKFSVAQVVTLLEMALKNWEHANQEDYQKTKNFIKQLRRIKE